jgi:TonB family protein
LATARSSYRGVLSDPGPGVGLTLVPSLLLHVPLVLMLAFGNLGEKDRPPLAREVFMVSAVVLPKAKALPKKAAAPKQPTPGEAGKKPEPPPRPDELVLKEKKAPEAEGPKIEPKPDPPKPEPTPKKRRNLADLVASVEEESDEVVFETSPEGSEDADPSQALKARFGKQLSAYERLVADAIKANWHPTAMRMPVPDELWAVVEFTIEENGALAGPSVEQGSGDWSYDSSCLRAITQTRRVRPPGPKDKRTVMLSFQPKDVR